MRAALFIALFYVAFFFIPKAFSDSFQQAHFKEELLQTPTKKVFQYDWSGLYGGLMLGGQMGRSSDKTGSFGYNADNDQWNYDELGLNAGAELGYNYTLYHFIIGPEIELGYLGMEGNGTQPLSPNFDTVGKSRSDFYTMFRARFGIDFDRYLIYATGGAIGINYNEQVVDDCNIAPCGGSTLDAKKNSFVWGYTVGGGIERLLLEDWSIKLEYLYFNLDSQNFSGTTNLGHSYDWTGKTSGNIIRVGINFHY